MNKKEFVDLVVKNRKALDYAIEQIKYHNDLDVLVTESWTAKDVIAHILWYEEEMIYLIDTRSMKRNTKIWNNPTDTRNQLVHNIIDQWTEKETLQRYESAGQKLIRLLQSIDQEMYDDPHLYDGMPPEWTPDLVFRGNTYKHYDEHLQQFSEKFAYLK